MKKLVTLVLLCTFYIGMAQNAVTHGKVTYHVDLEPFYKAGTEKIKNPIAEKIFKDLSIAAERMELELTFSDNLSRFRIKKGLRVGKEERSNFMLAKTLVCKGTYYTDLDKKIQILQTRQGGEVYSIKSSTESIQWQLTDEKKKIGDFICYKATYQKKVLDNSFLVTAWYAPNIPLAFGPGEYAGGLPGLIMEVYDHITHYRCTSIELNPKEKITIPFPDEATISTITEEEYRQKGNAAYQMLKKNKP
ncbi:GLPGLI family protein [Ascidiimonas aurantiaca]|uniref:GLPGLI family protein n=1 Tax=Ascidiimonas aurantiaca TaxID=1685432 RepID=UPI0030EE712D